MTNPNADSFDRERAEAAVRELLIAVGEDPDREGLAETPARVARAYEEVFAGLREDFVGGFALDLEFEALSLAHIADTGYSDATQCADDSLALRIQNFRLGHDIDNYTSHEIFALLYGA